MGRVEGSGRGGCVTLVWVLTGHRGGRRAEQGRRRQLAAEEEEEEEEAAASIANSTPSTHRPAFTLTFLWSLKGKGSPIAILGNNNQKLPLILPSHTHVCV